MQIRLSLQVVIVGLVAIVAWQFGGSATSAADVVFYLFWSLFALCCINFFNFADGINGYVGLGGLVSIISLLTWHVSISHTQTPFAWIQPILLLPLVIGLLAFLRANLIQRCVFMGDTGSTTLGLIVALLAQSPSYWLFGQITESNEAIGISAIIAASAALSVSTLMSGGILLDCAAMVFAKILVRFPISQAHRLHFYQRLARWKNLGHTRVSLGIHGTQAIVNSVLVVALLQQSSVSVALASAVILGGLVALGSGVHARALRRQMVAEPPKAQQPLFT